MASNDHSCIDVHFTRLRMFGKTFADDPFVAVNVSLIASNDGALDHVIEMKRSISAASIRPALLVITALILLGGVYPRKPDACAVNIDGISIDDTGAAFDDVRGVGTAGGENQNAKGGDVSDGFHH